MTSIEAIIDRQLRRWELERKIQESHAGPEVAVKHHQPVITISRQRGSGGTLIAEKLAKRFNYNLLHRDLIDKICETTGYKRKIIESIDEHTRSQMSIWFESVIVGKYVDMSDYVKSLLQTVSSLSAFGGVVVVGRGANFIVGPDSGFHIRVIAPRSMRVRQISQSENISEKDALREVENSDHERAEFVRKLFGKSIDDPMQYDLVINHQSISIESAVTLIAAAAMEKFEKIRGISK
jgi:cytidylate kinase